MLMARSGNNRRRQGMLDSVNVKSEDILSYLPTPPLGQDMTQGQFFKRSLTGLNSESSFS